MAILDRILTPGKLLQTESVAASSAGTAVYVGERRIFTVSVDAKAYLKWGGSAVTAAATDMLLPAAGIYGFASGNHFDYVSIFNPSATTALLTSVVGHFNS